MVEGTVSEQIDLSRQSTFVASVDEKSVPILILLQNPDLIGI